MSRIEWITDATRFAALAEPWDALADGGGTPFMRHGWLQAWWRAFGDGAELRVCTVWDGDELRAALPLQASGRRGLTALANVHSPDFRPLAADDAALEELAAAAVAASPAVILERMRAEDPAVGAFAGAGTGRLTLVDPQHVSPAVELTGDVKDFRKRSKPRWGAPLERFRRKMGRDHEAEMVMVEPPRDLEAELREGYAVEASGWKGENGTAIISQPATEQFYTEMSRAAAARDELRLASIRLDGRLVAWDLLLLFDGRLHLLKTGFDEEFRKLAPGLVLRLSVIERAYELGLRSHELGGSSDPWKLKFSDVDREHVAVRVYPRRPAGVARYGYRRVVRPALRAGYRRGRTLLDRAGD
jgi:CelD/BcsL family acetyltransferase involved in cellulose biosynthesis